MATADGDRTAIVHHPERAGPGAPLVVVLHGSRGTAAQAQADFGWDALADREGFVVAHPDGLGNSWNGGTCCRPATVQGVDDVGFLHALVGMLAEEDGVDLRRVHAVGFSNGAIAAYAWACGRPGDLAGIGPVAGQLLVDCAAPGPLTVVAVHGLADPVVPFDNPGPGEPTAAESLAPFLAAGGCSATSEVTRQAPATVSTWSCAGGRAVVLDAIDGVEHVWPGAGPDAGVGEAPTDATGFLWSRLREATSG